MLNLSLRAVLFLRRAGLREANWQMVYAWRKNGQKGSRSCSPPLAGLHVTCALEPKADRFWTFNERQAKLAKARGLKTK
jgi:hypothetical protein